MSLPLQRLVRIDARQLSGEHSRQGAGQIQTIGHYPTGALTHFDPGLTVNATGARYSPRAAEKMLGDPRSVALGSREERQIRNLALGRKP
jgi:hypothetical protein